MGDDTTPDLTDTEYNKLKAVYSILKRNLASKQELAPELFNLKSITTELRKQLTGMSLEESQDDQTSDFVEESTLQAMFEVNPPREGPTSSLPAIILGDNSDLEGDKAPSSETNSNIQAISNAGCIQKSEGGPIFFSSVNTSTPLDNTAQRPGPSEGLTGFNEVGDDLVSDLKKWESKAKFYKEIIEKEDQSKISEYLEDMAIFITDLPDLLSPTMINNYLKPIFESQNINLIQHMIKIKMYEGIKAQLREIHESMMGGFDRIASMLESKKPKELNVHAKPYVQPEIGKNKTVQINVPDQRQDKIPISVDFGVPPSGPQQNESILDRIKKRNLSTLSRMSQPSNVAVPSVSLEKSNINEPSGGSFARLISKYQESQSSSKSVTLQMSKTTGSVWEKHYLSLVTATKGKLPEKKKEIIDELHKAGLYDTLEESYRFVAEDNEKFTTIVGMMRALITDQENLTTLFTLINAVRSATGLLDVIGALIYIKLEAE